MGNSDNKIELSIPSQSIESEQAVLGCMLYDHASIPKVLQFIDETHFYKPAHTIIFKNILLQLNESGAVDTITVIERLQKTGKLDEVGGAYYITGLSNESPSGENVEYYASIVLEKYKVRQLINAAINAYKMNNSSSDEIKEHYFNAIQKCESKIGHGFMGVDEIKTDAMNRYSEIKYGITEYIKSGFPDIDNIIIGFEPGETVIIGARPSMGKTSLATCIALNIQSPVGIVSLETSATRLLNRIVSQKYTINGDKIKSGTMDIETMESYVDGVVKHHKIYINSDMNSSVANIIAQSKLLVMTRHVKVLIIDYLQLITGGSKRYENRNLELGDISRSLKLFANKEGVALILLSQLSRKGEKKMPSLSDLRDSGSIEQDADKVMFLWRPEKDGIKNTTDGENTENIAFIDVAKNRDGATGSAKLIFMKETASFHSYTPREYGGQDDKPYF